MIKLSDKMNKTSQFFVFFLISFLSFGQIGMGQWREHYNYHNCSKVIPVNEYVYALSESGILKYNTTTSEIDAITKINGLTDSKSTAIAYSKNYNMIIIGYENGNIDIIKDNEIININDIKRKDYNVSKKIQDIILDDSYAYLACGFGIVVLNLEKVEIKSSWLLGDNSSFLSTNKLLIKDNFIYATTPKGVYKGYMEDNLADFSNWEIISNNNYGNISFDWLKDKNFNYIVEFEGNLIINCSNEGYSDSLVVYTGNSWESFRFNSSMAVEKVYGLSVSKNTLFVCNWQLFYMIPEYSDIVNSIYAGGSDKTYYPQDICYSDSDNTILYIASRERGFFYHYLDYWVSKDIIPNCPITSNVYDMTSCDDRLYCAAGGRTIAYGAIYSSATYYKFENEKWTNYSSTASKNAEHLPAGLFDIVSIAVDPSDYSHVFLATWSNGLIELRNNSFYKVHNDTNSTLKAVLNRIIVSGLKFDKDGNLWMCNSIANPSFHILKKDGSWSSLNYMNFTDRVLDKLIITQDGNKWVTIPRGTNLGGLFVFNENETIDDKSDDKYKKLNLINELGETIGENEVNCIAEDKDGYIWIGTSRGVAVYYQPNKVFRENITARQVKVPRNNGTNQADLLLESETVTAITVDGDNKKWFGTASSGVYYTSADGLEEIYHFNTDNSPLPDNNILSISIIPNTGEVFIGTASGIISYRNVPIEPKENYSDIFAFPNPVEHDYDGLITITGLTEKSFVKITDISGNLVYETISEGGQAVWNGKNSKQNRVATGVYLVFVVAEDGSQKNITKILFIN